MPKSSPLASKTRFQARAAAVLLGVAVAGLALGRVTEASGIGPVIDTTAHSETGAAWFTLAHLLPSDPSPYISALLGEYPIEHAPAAICRPLTLCIR